MKWTLVKNKVFLGCQVALYTAGIAVAGKFVVPMAIAFFEKKRFSDTKKIEVTTSSEASIQQTSPSDTAGAEISDSDDYTSLSHLISQELAKFLIKVGEFIRNKK